MGAVDICRREARKVADEYDLRFNEWEVFEVDAQVDRLVGATLIVTNAAALVMIRTADRFAERFDLRRRESLAVRLERIFGEKRVRKDVEVMGAAKKWFTADDKAFLKRAARRVFEASDADDDFRMAA